MYLKNKKNDTVSPNGDSIVKLSLARFMKVRTDEW